MSFIDGIGQNYFLKKEDYHILLAQIIQSKLTKGFTNCIAWNICFTLNIIFQIKMVEIWSFDKYLSQFNKY